MAGGIKPLGDKGFSLRARVIFYGALTLAGGAAGWQAITAPGTGAAFCDALCAFMAFVTGLAFNGWNSAEVRAADWRDRAYRERERAANWHEEYVAASRAANDQDRAFREIIKGAGFSGDTE
jgi:hypothetical protein